MIRISEYETNKRFIPRFLTFILTLSLLISGIMGLAGSVANAAATTVTLRYGSSEFYGNGSYGGGWTTLKWVTHIDGEPIDLEEVPGVSRSYAYCVQPTTKSPEPGTYPVTVVDDDDTGRVSKMRKLIYYLPGSYGYAKVTRNRWFSDNNTGASDYAIGHMALSWIHSNYSDSVSEVWDGVGSAMESKTKNIVADLDNLPDPPATFEVFWIKVSGRQDVFGAFYATEYGRVKVQKTSSMPQITGSNSAYSLAGAEYTIYTDEACTQVAMDTSGNNAVLVTGADGSSDEITLETGNYYIKETKAPKGFALDSKVSPISIATDKTTTVNVQDEAQSCLINILLNKLDRERGDAEAQGDASLAGAVYKFSYYDGQYSDAASAENSGSPKAVWHFTTDANGKISGSNPALAPSYTSSELFKDSGGRTVFMLGTYVIQEVKASPGYLINNEKIAVRIAGGEAGSANVSSYNENTSSKEQVLRGGVKLSKIDADLGTSSAQGEATLEGAEFTIYNKSPHPVLVGGSLIGKDKEALVIRTNAAGIASSAANALPYGTYLVKETKPSAGYQLNSKWSKTFSIRTDGEIADLTSDADKVKEDIVRGGVKLLKIDRGRDEAYPQGDASLSGAEFTIYNKSGRVITSAGKQIANNAAVMTIKTNASGVAQTSASALPYGTYLVKETKAPAGYLLNSTWSETFSIRENGKIVDISDKPAKEDVIRGGVKLSKIDNDLDEAYAQGDASLGGAEFTIYNKSAQVVVVGGAKIAKDKEALVIRTDAAGITASAADALPYGTYLVKETKAPAGYLLNSKWSKTFSIRENGQIVDLSEEKTREAVVRGGVQILKRDKEIEKSEALGGASLEGIVMTIKNLSPHDVVVRADIGNTEDKINWKELSSKEELFEGESIKRVKPGEDIGKIITHWNEERNAYTAETLADDLPYGTYSIRESKTNSSYQRTDKAEHKFEIREDGVMVSYDENSAGMALVLDNYVYRSDVQGTKIGDGDSKRFSYVPFKITSVTNEETHVVVADKNGFFSTADRRTKDSLDEDEDADNTRKQNPFDDLLEAELISMEDIESRASDIKMGVWFGTGQGGTAAEKNDNFGALPYDSYTIEEMAFEGNEGYELQKFFFVVDEKSQNGLLDLETITNDYSDIPEIGTQASVGGKNVDVTPAKEITLIDVVEYENLKRGETYTVKGRLMDKSTGEIVKDAAGEDITAETTFKAWRKKGKVKVEFKFDGSNMHGMETVVFETLYDAEGHIIAKHEDMEDEGQTVTWEKPKPPLEKTPPPEKQEIPEVPEEPEEPVIPEIPEEPTVPEVPVEPEPTAPLLMTRARDMRSGTNTASAEPSVFIVDAVSYENLEKGQKYVVEGVLMDKETAEPLADDKGNIIKGKSEFTAESEKGMVEVEFRFNASDLGGKDTVVFEYLKKDGELIATHTDINSNSQTIHFKNLPKKKSPDTSDGAARNLLWYIFTMGISLAALILTAKRRNDRLN